MLNEYPEILMPKHLIKILGLSKNTIYSMLNNGTLPAYRIGNGKIWRINKTDLIDYLSQNRSYW
jgi:excisionase family DNA binding protein